jgi:preprotein translocase subunit YajC
LNWFSLLLLLAAAEEQKTESYFWVFGPPLLIIMAVYMILDSPQKREKAKRETMLKNMKKDDRVVTIGGILGSVANISQDGKEITLKVDDGTRIRFRRTAIAEVLSGEPAPEAPKTT